ncbi:hypothetical protein AUC61_15035 [Pseudomonas sp. S25]|uniref:DUF2790 domain-containing protein n=1 Tax=Pseudomonas maioricensis TaxID=1766623 RepID=A0ABS9ZPQ9_9PSED|nr:DUF2790 domain-containing protein [Pseudomonas sp. S25]MCI8210848.1 hypothetical protein [Pseudomonas sp. S25]
MKNFALFAALSFFSVFASANDSVNNNAQLPPSVDYNYSQNLDIAKVLKVTSAESTTCGPVQAHMLYLDSKGVEHNLQYTRISGGNNCQNG